SRHAFHSIPLDTYRDFGQTGNDFRRLDNNMHRIGSGLAFEENIGASYVRSRRKWKYDTKKTEEDRRRPQGGELHLLTLAIQLPSHNPTRQAAIDNSSATRNPLTVSGGSPNGLSLQNF